MTYQQPPYQTTVAQPVVVQPVQPVVVPVMTQGRFFNMQQGPAHLRNGAKLGSHHVPGPCIMIMTFFGCGLSVMSLFILMTTHWDMSFWAKFDMSLPPTVIPAIILGLIGGTLSIISAFLCMSAKKNYEQQRSQENTSPQSEQFTDAGNTNGHVYSGQGQPAVGKPTVVGMGSPMYVPVQSGMMVPPTAAPLYTNQTPGMVYPNAASSVPYSAPMSAGPQPSYPGINTVPGESSSSVPPPYSAPEKAAPAPEYDQQPAYAPPGYSQYDLN